MARSQEAAMPSARYVHPEFGYFCPTPRLRRRVRVVLACMVFGAIGVAMLRAGHDPDDSKSPNSSSALMMTRVDGGSGAEAGSQAGPAPAAGALGLRPALSQGPKTACEQDTWAYLDGKCTAGKARKARVVRVPTNRPAIATIPIGRSPAPVAGAAEPAPSIAAGPDNRKGDLSPSKPAQSAPAESAVVAAAAATEPAQPPVAAPKKPQKTANHQNRRRERNIRVEPLRPHGYASVPDNRYGPFGGFFSVFR
jgi:hypothetical protein